MEDDELLYIMISIYSFSDLFIQPVFMIKFTKIILYDQIYEDYSS